MLMSEAGGLPEDRFPDLDFRLPSLSPSLARTDNWLTSPQWGCAAESITVSLQLAGDLGC